MEIILQVIAACGCLFVHMRVFRCMYVPTVSLYMHTLSPTTQYGYKLGQPPNRMT